MLVGRARLARELRALGVRDSAIVLVHARMSALGTVVGGAEMVVRALLDAVGPGGTIVGYLGWEDSPPDDLDALPDDERELIEAEQPIYDPMVARARRDHGRVAEVLRTWPGAVHSGHPEAGVAAIGAAADWIARPHPLDDAYADGTPYARVVEADGQVALVGAPLSTVTLVHHAEAIARVDGKRRVTWRCPVLADGRREWRTLSDVDTSAGALPYEHVTDEDYVAFFARAALDAGYGRSGPLGDGVGYVLEARPLVAHTVAAIEAAFSPQQDPRTSRTASGS